jgi:hypothetical protein
LLDAGERVLAYCDENKMNSRDLEVLRENLRRLRASAGIEKEAGFAVQVMLRGKYP